MALDNIFICLHKISMLRIIIESKLQEEFNSLELRNLEVIKNIYNCHRQELEGAHKLFECPDITVLPLELVIQCLVYISPLKKNKV